MLILVRSSVAKPEILQFFCGLAVFNLKIFIQKYMRHVIYTHTHTHTLLVFIYFLFSGLCVCINVERHPIKVCDNHLDFIFG